MRPRLRFLLVVALAWLALAPRAGQTRSAQDTPHTQLATDTGGEPWVAGRSTGSRGIVVPAARLSLDGALVPGPCQPTVGTPARSPSCLPRAFASARFHATLAAPRGSGDPPRSR